MLGHFKVQTILCNTASVKKIIGMYKSSNAKFGSAAGLALLGCLHVETIKHCEHYNRMEND